MIRRIIFIIISLAVVITGIIGFNRLHYWERSARIFSMNGSQQFERGFGRHQGRFDGRDRNEIFREGFERQELPDSLRHNLNFEDRQFSNRDSTRERFGGTRFPGDRNEFQRNENFRRGDRGRGGHFRGGSKIQLFNVGWFFAVFAMLTVFTVYLDKGVKKIRKRR